MFVRIFQSLSVVRGEEKGRVVYVCSLKGRNVVAVDKVLRAVLF